MPSNDKNKFIPSEDKGGFLAEELESRRAWVSEWINNPEYKRRAIASLNRNAGEVSLSDVSKRLRYDFTPNTSEEYAEDLIKTNQERLRTVTSSAGDFINNKKRFGEYDSEEHHVNVSTKDFNQGKGSGAYSVHEFTHASGADEAVPAMNVYDKDIVNPRDFENSGYVDYLRQDDEVYSRLMEMRYKFGIQPGQTFNEEEIQRMRENRDDSMKLFDIFKNEDIQDMLNNWSAEEGLDPNTIG